MANQNYMKNLTLCFFLLLLASDVFSQQEKRTESTISNITVFLNKAQITRKVRTRIEAGKTNIIVTGLTAQLDQQSIQVSGKGAFVIMGISHQQNFLNEFNVPKPLQVLRDSLEFLQRQLTVETTQKEILNKEEQMLLSNQKIGGANQNLSVAELRAMADFYRARLGDIVIARLRQDEKIKKLNQKIERVQRQINEKNETYGRNTSEIVISLSAEAAVAVELDISYVVGSAGWQAVYDLRGLNTKSPVQLSYKANVFQNTGEEWANVKLRLSTANPSLGGLKPELAAWFLNFYDPVQYSQTRPYRMKRESNAPSAVPAMAEEADNGMGAGPSETIADFVTTVQTSLNTEFEISLPYTVSSSNKPTLVDIRNYELKAEYLYSVAPKLDRDAFLIAKATGWEELSLLPGEANVFFEGTFVGKTFIDPNSIQDTLSISMGRDKRIVVKREKLKDFSSRKLIGTNQRASYGYEISVRNTKAEAIRIRVEDQIPVSQNSLIEVTVLETGGAAYHKGNGKLDWEMEVSPNETKSVVYKYEIKYPKDKTIAGLE